MAVEEARQNQGQPEFLLSEIVLPVDTPAQEVSVRQDAARLVQTVREGASFGALARQVSVAASAERGGDVGWVPASSIPPELLPTLEELAPGEISDPIRSNVGYHVFLLRDRRLGRPPLDDQSARVEVALAQIVFPTGGGSGPETDAKRAEAARLRDGLETCADVVALAEELDAPASGDLGWLEVGELPPGLGDAVLALPVGEISPPLQGPAGIHLIMVCDRRDPPGLVPEREQISERLQNERIDRLARRYLRDLRKQAFVEVRI
jgi:peptidyl-prolyl cis-trans isomerase SurA